MAESARHFEEHCGCDPGCGHGSYCGSPEHGDEAPDWPCDAVLALTGDASAEAFFQREGDEYVARVQANCPHPERDGSECCMVCGAAALPPNAAPSCSSC